MQTTITSLNDLPHAILEQINNHLPVEDQLFTMPLVGKIWNQINQETNLSNMLKKEITAFKYTKEQKDIFVKLLRENDFIRLFHSLIGTCERGGSCSTGLTKIISESKDSKNTHILGCHEGYSIFIPFFTISWNPQTLKLNEDKRGNFRATFGAHAPILKLSPLSGGQIIPKKLLLKFEEFSCHNLISAVERKGRISWKHISAEDNLPMQMKHLIGTAFQLQLNSHLNFISQSNFFTICDRDPKANHLYTDLSSAAGLSFLCNKEGLIVNKHQGENQNNNNQNANQNDSQEGIKFVLKIENQEVNGKSFPVLIWQSNCYDENKEKNCTADDLFRWSVFSATAQKLAMKLGIAISDDMGIDRLPGYAYSAA